MKSVTYDAMLQEFREEDSEVSFDGLDRDSDCAASMEKISDSYGTCRYLDSETPGITLDEDTYRLRKFTFFARSIDNSEGDIVLVLFGNNVELKRVVLSITNVFTLYVIDLEIDPLTEVRLELDPTDARFTFKDGSDEIITTVVKRFTKWEAR